jgi:hypothetical protein
LLPLRRVNKKSQILSLAGWMITTILPKVVCIITLAVFLRVQGGVLVRPLYPSSISRVFFLNLSFFSSQDAATIFTAINLLHRFSSAVSGL